MQLGSVYIKTSCPRLVVQFHSTIRETVFWTLIQKSLQKADFFPEPFGKRGSVMPGTSCTAEQLTVPSTFCFNFFKYLEEQKRAFHHRKSLTITSPALLHTHLSLVEMLEGPDAYTQTEERLRQIERECEIRWDKGKYLRRSVKEPFSNPTRGHKQKGGGYSPLILFSFLAQSAKQTPTYAHTVRKNDALALIRNKRLK